MPLTEQMEVPNQQYCLRWKYHHSNLQVMFAQLLERESFCDVTLACEGKTLRAHKMMLSACSTYFDSIFSKHEEKDPIVILKDVKFDDIKALVEFMYKGEINVDNSQLSTLLHTAEDLRIKGLAAVSWRSEGEGSWRSVEQTPSSSLPQNKNQVYQYGQQRKKRRLNPDFLYVQHCPKFARINSNQQPVEEYVTDSNGDEDSQEGMWDTRSHEDVYSEPEETKPQGITNSNMITNNSITVPTTVITENESSIKAEPDQPDIQTSTPRTPSSITSGQPIKAELMDVIKMTAYIQQGGRRPHFWETSSTKRVMEAIKNKEIEMKVAAELLGVSYGTLYGRYRDAYGCLKHPYRYTSLLPYTIYLRVKESKIHHAMIT
ncbi:transcription regulator protein BACH2-like isoform X2 [Cimex lectularius]|uniref:BTB domain-containing protein n=1 Tax=Cimex lectularius TaxID=79782 RepID=A0A8I6SSS6_CIMLE|nr:transcription regulator protein BACH2-like isoform X2 [Cimex lectularius]